MSKPVILFRAFNAFLSQTVSVWSVGMIVAPSILSLVMAGFFASSLVVPLIIVCAIVGVIALIWAACIGYWRYHYLTHEANKFLNRYEFKVLDVFPLEADIPLNTVIVVRQSEKQAVACFKRYIKDQFEVVSVDLDDLTAEEKSVISLPEMEMTPINRKKRKNSISVDEETVPTDRLAKMPVQHSYTFVPPSAANGYGQKLKENEICLFKAPDGSLYYSVITTRGITVVDQIIPIEEIEESQREKFNQILKAPELTLKLLEPFQNDIFKVTLKNGHTTRHSAINQIIQRALAVRAHRRMGSAHESDQLNQAQQRILTWEKVNTFFSDAPNAFAFSGIIIFIITHVFFGALIPATLLIALVISIAYGGLSAFVRDAQTDSKLKAMQEVENRYEFLTRKINTAIKEVNAYVDKADNLIKRCQNVDRADLNTTETEQNLEQQTGELKRLEQLKGELIEVHNSAHLEFTSKEQFRVVYALFYGQIVAGAFLYLALPLMIGALGFPPLSLPILLGIIAPIALFYGIYSMYHKMKVIEQEKWIAIDDKKIEKINNKLEALDSQQLNESFTQVKALEQQLTQEEVLLLPQLPQDKSAPPVQFPSIQDIQSQFQQFGQNASEKYQFFAEEVEQTKNEVVEQVGNQFQQLGQNASEKYQLFTEGVEQVGNQFKTLFPTPPVEIEMQNVASGTPTLNSGTDSESYQFI